MKFQLVDVEYTTNKETNVSTIHLFGRKSADDGGGSVAIQVTDFWPYLYVLGTDVPVLGQDVDVKEVETVTRTNLYGYNQPVEYLKVTLWSPKDIPTLRNRLSKAGYSVFEADFAYTLRFLTDYELRPCGWIELDDEALFDWDTTMSQAPSCSESYHVEAHPDAIHAAAEDDACHAPLRIMSFDIEVAGRRGVFPEHKVDPVIQIALTVVRLGDDVGEPLQRTILTWRSCSDCWSAEEFGEYKRYRNEYDMLKGWFELVRSLDIDILTGYNTDNFDIPYLVDRAKQLRVWDIRLGRMQARSYVKGGGFSSKQRGSFEQKTTYMPGRIGFDMLPYIRAKYKLRSYKLNDVATEFLGDKKDDMHYTEITDLWNGTDSDRTRLARYCVQDAALPLRLMFKLMALINTIEMSRITGVPIGQLLTRGQTIKALCLLYRKALARGYVVPYFSDDDKHAARRTSEMASEGDDDDADDTFEGATVIAPKRGYYQLPIATLDFSSLYPSIIIHNNLCYTTLVRGSIDHAIATRTSPTRHTFVTAEVRRGILPEILEELLAARRVAKRAMAAEQQPFRRSILDGRQLALKLTANSVYGFTGARTSKLYCVAISESVTSYGRTMLETVERVVRERYPDADIVYGDTDSVFVNYGDISVAECMDRANTSCALVNTHFQRPVSLEFEKVLLRLLLLNKKKYAGQYHEGPDGPVIDKKTGRPKIFMRGIETVRRDNCLLVSETMNTVLDELINNNDPAAAQQCVRNVVSQLYMLQVPTDKLVISAELKSKEYKTKQIHSELAARMQVRDPATAPRLGDRVPYIFVPATRGSKAYERAEDPRWAAERGVMPDPEHYVKQQLCKPLTRIMSPIIGDDATARLFTGAHTRKRKLVLPKSGGIMNFAHVLPTGTTKETKETKESEATKATVAAPTAPVKKQKQTQKQSKRKTHTNTLFNYLK